MRTARGEDQVDVAAWSELEVHAVRAIELGHGNRKPDETGEVVAGLIERGDFPIESPWTAVSALLVALRKHYSLTNVDLASATGVDLRTLQQIHRGDPAATPAAIDSLLDVYQTLAQQRLAAKDSSKPDTARDLLRNPSDETERGCRIRAIRVGLGLSLAAFAAELERKPATIAKYEAGTNTPSTAQLDQLEEMETAAANRLGGSDRLEQLTDAIVAASGGAKWPYPREEPQYMGRFLARLMAERDLEPWDLQGLLGCTPQQIVDRIAGRTNLSGGNTSRLINVFDLGTTHGELRTKYGIKPAASQRSGSAVARPPATPGPGRTSSERRGNATQGRKP